MHKAINKLLPKDLSYAMSWCDDEFDRAENILQTDEIETDAYMSLIGTAQGGIKSSQLYALGTGVGVVFSQTQFRK